MKITGHGLFAALKKANEYIESIDLSDESTLQEYMDAELAKIVLQLMQTKYNLDVSLDGVSLSAWIKLKGILMRSAEKLEKNNMQIIAKGHRFMAAKAKAEINHMNRIELDYTHFDQAPMTDLIRTLLEH